MRSRIFLLILIIIFIQNTDIEAQIGFKGGVSYVSARNVTQYLENNAEGKVVFPLIYEFSAGYNFQFPNSSAMLMPGIGYSFSNSSIGEIEYKMKRYIFELPFKLYPFNMEGECGCPDFSIRSKFFEKHFFLLLNSAVNLEQLRKGEGVIFSDLNYKFGVGAGLALTLLEGLVISPSVSYNLVIDDQWDAALLDPVNLESITDNHSEPVFELRFNYIFRD